MEMASVDVAMTGDFGSNLGLRPSIGDEEYVAVGAAAGAVLGGVCSFWGRGLQSGETIKEALEGFRRSHSEEIQEAAGYYRRIRQDLDEISNRIKDSLEKDHAEAKEREYEENKIAAVVLDFLHLGRAERIRDEMRGKLYGLHEELEKACEEALKNLDVPEEIRDAAQNWKSRDVTLRRGLDPVAEYRHIEGWEGAAQRQYSQMAKIQHEASRELALLPGDMAEILEDVAVLNSAVLLATRGCLVHILMSQTRYCYLPIATFRRSAVLANDMREAIKKIQKITSEAQSTLADKVRNRINRRISSLRVIDPRWPVGVSKSDSYACISDESRTGERIRRGRFQVAPLDPTQGGSPHRISAEIF